MAKIIDKGFAKPDDPIFSAGWRTSTPLVLNRSTKISQKGKDEKPKLVASNKNPKPVTQEELDHRQIKKHIREGVEEQNRRNGCITVAGFPVKE